MLTTNINALQYYVSKLKMANIKKVLIKINFLKC